LEGVSHERLANFAGAAGLFLVHHLSPPGYALDTAGSCSMPSHSQRFRIWKKANTTTTSTFSIEEVLHSRTM
jgi:hypothetical protein